MDRENGASPRQIHTLKEAIANPYSSRPPTRDPPPQPAAAAAAAAEQLESLTRMNLAARTPTPTVASDPILPGISTPESPGRRRSATTSPEHASSSRVVPIRPGPNDDPARLETRRLRTRTLDELSHRPSNVPPRSNQRSRVGSMNQALAPTAPPTKSTRHDSISATGRRMSDAVPAQKTAPQKTSGPSHGIRDSSRGRGSSRPRSAHRAESDMPVTDPRTMHLLMTKSRGRMRGKVAYITISNSSWTSAWCSIDSEEGSLLCEAEPGSDRHSILVPDLRGCFVTASLDPHSGQPLLNLYTADDTMAIQLRPLNEAYFNAWFAALLCWHPVPPGQNLDSVVRHAPTPLGWLSEHKGLEQRTHLATNQSKTKIIKVGRIMLVEAEQTQPLQKSTNAATKLRWDKNQPRQYMPPKWNPVRIVLAEDGNLKLLSDDNADLLAQVSLNQLSRSAIQRLHPTVIDVECCVAIYPQYSRSADACSCLRPIYLSFEERTVYEAWFVLLRAFTIPEIYGPHNALSTEHVPGLEDLPGLPRSAAPSLLRIERSLRLRIDKVKLKKLAKVQRESGDRENDSDPTNQTHEVKKKRRISSYYIDILVDGQRRAKTSAKEGTWDPYWSEQFEFFDIATTVSTVCLRLKKVDQPVREINTSWFHDDDERERPDDRVSNIIETCCGEIVIQIGEINHANELDECQPLCDDSSKEIGELSYRIRYKEEPILMQTEYEQLETLILNYPNALAIQVCDRVPGELTPLALCFLNVFQCCDKAEEWLMALAEEEIDGIMKDPPAVRNRFTRRLDSSGSRESLRDSADREGTVRDLNKHATAEANLLFRGNTLASKAIDYHMKRLGRTYLDATIGPSLREIAIKDLDCEVNPNKVTDKRKLANNWRRLMKATEDMWEKIYNSVERCPPELRVIFRHIRACANDRYGDYLRTVTYSSVSGFLFLRFFCAAILGPHAFDLLKHEPGAKAVRCFTLIAKSLQGLANMTTFGNKEPWMEPMNKFLNAHRQQFKDFIDRICDISHSTPLHAKSPSYSTPLQIYGRLPGPTREGFPSLPYHIDRARNLATIVNLWLDNYNSMAASGASSLPQKFESDLGHFHELCLGLRQRTSACYDRVELAERHSSSFSHEWVSIAERMEVAPSEFWIKQRVHASNYTLTSTSTSNVRDVSPMFPSTSAPSASYMSAMASAMAAGAASQAKRGTSNERSARSSVDRRRPLQQQAQPAQAQEAHAQAQVQPIRSRTRSPAPKPQIYTAAARPTSKMSNQSAPDIAGIENQEPVVRPELPTRHSSSGMDGSNSQTNSRPGSVSAAAAATASGFRAAFARSSSLRDLSTLRTISMTSSRTSHESDRDSMTDARRGKHYTNAERRVRDEEEASRASRSGSRERDRSRLGSFFSRRKKLDKKDSYGNGNGNEPDRDKTRPMTDER